MTRVRVPREILRAIERLVDEAESQLQHVVFESGEEIQEHDTDCELIRRWLREKWGEE